MPALEADICVIGAGPAGLSLATGLVGHGLDVLVLESGSETPDRMIQGLNDGAVIGDAYAGLAATRCRGVGGTAGIWNTLVEGEIGAKCVPLDPADLAHKPAHELTGWPLSTEDVEPYYRKALALCELPDSSFDGSYGVNVDRRPYDGLGYPLVSRVYRFVSRRTLLANTHTIVAASGAARLRCDSTVVGLDLSGDGSRVRTARIASSDGSRFTVAARRFVLAGGAVENARLLLLSGLPESDWVGRCFMEHPRDSSLRARPRRSSWFRDSGFYDVHAAADGGRVLGRLGLAGEALEDGLLPNASATLLPGVRPMVHRLRRALGPVGRRDPVARLLPAGGHGWSTHPSPGAVFEDFTVLLNVEQLPHPENRIVLGSDRDAFGVPRAELHWRWRAKDESRLARLRRVVVSALEATGGLEVTVTPSAAVDPNAHHHAGTTRMHPDPRLGVVDPDLRVHGTENLFATGGSAFPTAGFANPLLTILALSLRLGDHLASSL